MAAPIVHIFDVGDYEAQIRRGAELLRSGGVVTLPTETVYGAAGLVTHESARKRLADLRGGGGGNGGANATPFTLHLARRDDARQYLGDLNEFEERLLRKLWPGPVGLVFDVPAERRRGASAALKLPESEIYDGETITLRCPDHVVATDVLSAVDGPVAMTVAGANAAGAHWTPEAMAQELDGKVDLIFDAGPSHYLKPSTILRVSKDGYEIVRQGVYDERIIQRLLRTTILFVCSGNTCRSPMAEAITRRVLAEQLHVPEPELEARKGISVLSAGSYALPGARANPHAVEALRDLGADLSHHRSRPLTVELIHQADVIYTMGRSHAAAVQALVPSALEKVATLDPAGDIDDPIGGDASLYRDLAGQLQTLIERRLQEKVLA
jgi:tRNA threonylcarbamoyl adenosine modification protein (Sua5/YciO/YrdC/YwlC family)